MKAAVFKLAAGKIGDPSTFELLGTIVGGGQKQIECRYGSDDRNEMTSDHLLVSGDQNFQKHQIECRYGSDDRWEHGFEFTLVYQRDGGSGVAAAAVPQKILKLVSQSTI